MISEFGNLTVVLSILTSFFLIIFSIIELKNNNSYPSIKLRNFSILQLIFTNLSFLTLLMGYLISDFSIENVYENSHTEKPLLYKISGVWGYHECSLLLWINVLVLFYFLFFSKNFKKNKKFQLLTLIFQNILILGFFIFLFATSNPFNKIFPIPSEGLGLNPILQDPALAIHPPLLYLGFVGSSIYFSAALASLISRYNGKDFAIISKPWVLVSWIFQTLGILVGSIWAYYELGWGGYWFWDPVENSSLIPWFLMTALLHSILVLEKRSGIYLWVVVLSILTFTMSVTGTFLVRSGILNSVHTFANDPTRGLYILIFLSAMIFSSIYIFYKYSPIENRSFNLFSKEFFIIINNWFMSFFLITVLIGTVYPIFLEVLTSQKISIGPPYYNAILAPFLIPLLFLMAYGPTTSWIISRQFKTKKIIYNLFLSIVITSIIILTINQKNFLINVLLIASVYLILQNIIGIYKNTKKSSGKPSTPNLASAISHVGFGLLIFFISLNSVTSIGHDLNIKAGEKKSLENFDITLEELKVFNEKNYKKFVGNIVVLNKKTNNIERLKPEIRIYKNPETITYEASIRSNIFSDTYVTMSNISKSEFYNIKFQKKPFMNLIWFSTILIVLGGMLRLISKKI